MVDTLTGFVPPNKETCKKAIGDYSNTPWKD